MRWPSTTMLKQLPIELPEGVDLDQLGPEDIPNLIEKLRIWYPGIAVGEESCHLQERFYLENAFLKGGDYARFMVPIVFSSSGRPIALITLFKNDLAKSVYSRMGAVDPKFRGKGIAYAGPRILEAVARAINAELIYYFATLLIPQQQIVAEKLGFYLSGIVPGNDREMIYDGVDKRVFEALYTKPLVEDTDLFIPKSSCLTENTRQVWAKLFASNPRWGITD